jgi:hypothetical protein
MSFFLGRALTVGFLLSSATLLACGNSENDEDRPHGGAGQANGGAAGSGAQAGGGARLPPGFSTTPTTIHCGGDCSSATLGIGTSRAYIDPCCTGANQDACGLDTSFLMPTGASAGESCEPRNQPGAVDASCPSPAPAMIPTMGATVTLDPMPGCCRADTGICGVMVDRVTAGGGLLPLADLDLGCVDAALFFDGAAPVPCGDTGAGGAGGGSGEAGAGGAP